MNGSDTVIGEWETRKRKLDVIASANGCKVVDYDLAWHKRQTGFWDEYATVAVSAGLGFAVGVLSTLMHVGVL